MPEVTLSQQAAAIAALANWARGGPTPRQAERAVLADHAQKAEYTIRRLAGAENARTSPLGPGR